MRLPKELIERKLSAALNARVSIDALSLAPLRGSIEAVGVTIAAIGATEPLLTVRRVQAEVSVGALLKKELVVKSVVIEGPTIAVVRGEDGTFNLPKRKPKPETTVENAPQADDDGPTAWKLAAENVRVLDGSAEYRDATYHVAARRVVCELLRKPDGFHLTALAASVARQDEPLDLGEARAHGVIHADDLAAIPDAPVEATFDVGEVVHGTVRRAGSDIAFGVRLKSTLAVMRKLVPARLLPPIRAEGQVELSAEGSVGRVPGLRLSKFELRATDVRVSRDDAVA